MKKHSGIGIMGVLGVLLFCNPLASGQSLTGDTLSVTSATAQSLTSGSAWIHDLTGTDLTITGTADFQANTLLLGTWGDDPGQSALNILYTDGASGTNSGLTLLLTRPTASWTWSRLAGPAGLGQTIRPAMQLDAANRLILTGTAATNPPQIVLNPNGTSTLSNGLNVAGNIGVSGSIVLSGTGKIVLLDGVTLYSRDTLLNAVVSHGSFAGIAASAINNYIGGILTQYQANNLYVTKNPSPGGTLALAVGSGASASYPYSMALGCGATAGNAYSTSIGYGTVAPGYAQTVLGQYNAYDSTLQYTGTSATWVPTQDLFIIGNGTGSNNRSNAFVIKKNGNTAINGNLLTFGLRASGTNTVPGLSLIYTDGTAGNSTVIALQSTQSTSVWNWQRLPVTGTTPAIAMQLDAANRLILNGTANTTGTTPPQIVLNPNGTSTLSGSLGIGTASPQAKLDVAGDVKVSGSLILSNTSKLVLPDGTVLDSYNTLASAVTNNNDFYWVVYNQVNNAMYSYTYGYLTQWDADNRYLANNAYGGMSSLSIGGGYGYTYSYCTTAVGYNAEARSSYSTALGYGAAASGECSTALGYYTNAIGQYSVALGYGAMAYGKQSTAIGYNTVATGYAQTVVGQYNAYDNTDWWTSSPSWVPTEDLFIVGNGTDEHRSNAFVVKKNGDAVVTGTLTATKGLVVTGTTSAIAMQLDAANRLILTGTAATNPSQIILNPNGSSTLSGSLGIGTASPQARLDVAGDVKVSGSLILSNTSKLVLPDGTVLDSYNTLASAVTNNNDFYWVVYNQVNNAMYSYTYGYLTQWEADYRYLSNNTYGTYSLAINGYNYGYNYTYSSYATVVGYDATANNYSTALGYGARADGERSSALGYNTVAIGYAQTVVGQFNDYNASGTSSSWVPTDGLFIIGNGSDASHRSNAFVVKKNGDAVVSGTLTATKGIVIPGTLFITGTTEKVVAAPGNHLLIPEQGDISMGEFVNGPRPE